MRIDPATGSAWAWTAALALFAVLSLAQLVSASAAHDYFQFWAFGRHVAESGGDALYAETTARSVAAEAVRRVRSQSSARGVHAARTNHGLYPSGVEPISTPFYYATFAALTRGDYDADLIAFQLASSAALLVGGWLACRALGYSRLATAFALCVTALIFAPLHADIETGNANRLQLAWLAAALALARRGGAAGFTGSALLGAAVAWKPNLAGVPLLLAVVWVAGRSGARAMRAAAGWAVGLALAAGASAAWLGASAWGDWISALARYGTHAAGVAQGNWSAARLASEAVGADLSWTLGVALFGSFAACAARARDANGRDAEWIAVAAGGLLPLLASPIAWDHYFVLALPALAWCLRPTDGPPARWVAGSLALALLAVNPLRIALPGVTPRGLACGLALGSAALWVLLLRDLVRAPGREGPGDAGHFSA